MAVLNANIRCHHGHLDNRSGICICDDGWTSAPWDHDALGPSTSIIHMCTLQLLPWSETDRLKSRIAGISIIAIFLALMFLLCTFALNTLWRYAENDLDNQTQPVTSKCVCKEIQKLDHIPNPTSINVLEFGLLPFLKQCIQIFIQIVVYRRPSMHSMSAGKGSGSKFGSGAGLGRKSASGTGSETKSVSGAGSGSKTAGSGSKSESVTEFVKRNSESVEKLLGESTLSSEDATGQSERTSSARNTD